MSDGKPKIAHLAEGVIECPNCSELSGLTDLKELEVHECSSCKIPFFVPKKLKHYWLYRPLGGGGMGSVYRALSEKDPGEYAIKILPRKQKASQELIDTLMLEGEVGKILGKSPHIVEVVDYGMELDEYFMASRFVEGTRLDIFVSSASRLSERQALDIITQIIEAEIHIKNCGYLFRDMKPENIIIVEETMTVKLFDFGLCMSLEHAANPDPDSSIEGSPYYLPPERIVASPEGEYSEVYSLGLLLFYMLAGTTYFSEADVKDLVTKHVRSLRVASVSSRLKDCSPMIVDAVDKMIKRDPNQRYHTLTEVAEVLEEVSKGAEGYPLNSMEVPGGMPGVIEEIKPKKSLSLKPVFITFVIMAVIAVLGMGGWYYYKMKQEKDLKKIILETTAARLDIPVDVKAPPLSEYEIQNLIDSKAKKIYDEELSYIRNFNEKFEKAKICKELQIDISSIDKKPPLLKEVRKVAKKELNSRIEKELKLIKQEFPREKFEKQIADELGVKFPLSKNIKDRKEIIKIVKQEAEKEADSKFPAKRLSIAIAKLVEQYKCYKVGDRVTVPSRSGEKITGTFQGMSGRHIVVNGRDILIADLPLSLSIKFDQPLSDKKASESIKKVTAEFDNKKAEYAKSVYLEELEKLYKENQYVKQNRKWFHASTVIKNRLKAKQKDFEKKQMAGEEKIIISVKQSFNEEEFLKKYGYRLINKKWIPEAELVNRRLQKKKNEFLSKRNKKIEDLEKEARISAELEVYGDNGYIYRNGKWQPAKKLLDNELRKALKTVTDS